MDTNAKDALRWNFSSSSYLLDFLYRKYLRAFDVTPLPPPFAHTVNMAQSSAFVKTLGFMYLLRNCNFSIILTGSAGLGGENILKLVSVLFILQKSVHFFKFLI